MNSRKAILGIVLTAFLCFPLYLFSELDGAPPRRSGGNFPGEQSCGTSECHNVTPNEGFPGSVSISINGIPVTAYQYLPGETVPVIVTVSDPDQIRAGFQITARTSDGCAAAGSFATVPSDMNVLAQQDTATHAPCPESTVEAFTHFFPKELNASASFELNWTAPMSDIGGIIFAAAGNAANGNNLNTGDRIYTTQTTVPAIAIGGEPPTAPAVLNAATNVLEDQPEHAISPGSIISIYGEGFASHLPSPATVPLSSEQIPLSTTLADLTVTFDGNPAPIFEIFRGEDLGKGFDQINAQLPWEVMAIPGKTTASMVITSNGVSSEPRDVWIAPASPGIFSFLFGPGPAIVQNFKIARPEDEDVIDLSFSQPEGFFPPPVPPATGPVAQPAAIGGVIIIWSNGLGPLTGSVPSGDIPRGPDPENPTVGAPLLFAANTVRVFVGGVEAQVLAAFLHPANVP